MALVATGCGNSSGTRAPYKIDSKYAVGDPQFLQTMGNLLGPPILEGNSVQSLVNGDQIFPAMLEAIHGAKKTITFETYVYWSGKIGKTFTDALAERAKAGVKVHVIIDSVGSQAIKEDYLKEMGKAGVEIVSYHRLEWYDITSANKLNNRTHRKLLIIDGVVGFTGGAGVADEWLGDADSPEHWRDTHYKVEGPAVAQLQAAFVDNWMETTGHVLHGDEYFPIVGATGEYAAQVFRSSSDSGSESMELMYLLSISAARTSVKLASAYFVPDDQTIDALVAARKRGVNVQIIVPGKIMDQGLVRRASRARWEKLLKAGVEIYEYQPTMYHVKLMIVDDLWSSIGSANLDNRSFRLNDEANLNVINAKFAEEQATIFEEDRKRSLQITYEMWKDRPFGEKFIEGFSSIFGWMM